MENSFFEYRDNNNEGSDSDTEAIDDSISLENSFATKNSNFKNNKTAFVAESEESTTSDESEEEEEGQSDQAKNAVITGAAGGRVILSSDDDKHTRFNRKTELSCRKVVLSSSDEEVSPEMVPRRPPLIKSRSNSSSSFIGRKVKKRMILIDSDTENSIIIEQKQNNKQKCLKDTPLKVDDGNMLQIRKALNMEAEMNLGTDENDSKEASGADVDDKGDSGNDDDSSDDGDGSETEDEGPDEDQMVMSRATRMSIMGVVPKNFDSDDSDFIQSDDSNLRSRGSCGSTNSLTDLPNVDVTTHKSPEKPTEPDKDGDTSKLTCSPFSSPLKDITQELNDSILSSKEVNNKNQSNKKEIAINNNSSLKDRKSSGLRNKVLNRQTLDGTLGNKENIVKVEDDDDVTIIDSKPEIIALSSDDEYEEKSHKKTSLSTTKNDSSNSKQIVSSDMRQFLVPPSYPNQVVYVKKHVRENELNKLNALKEDLHNIRHLLDNMEMDTLPDGGRRLVQRLSELEEAVRKQGDKVAGMVVEPDKPTAADIANDGFGDKVDKGLSWDEIQKASNAVQPRMFGKQAMATHMAERSHILDRLRDLHESLASRPPETELGSAPKALRSQLMPHQLHALAWLRWRETQRPSGGILADDMGLGKTITMISLILSDKEKIDNEDDEDDEWSSKGNSKLIRGGTLVVCPATLIQQWAGEVSKHCVAHSLSVCMHHGAARSPHPHRVGAHDVVVTTYNILQRDNEKNGVLMRINWRRIILDEAHIVRNYKSATSAAVSALRGRRRWCLTGTPVQNKDLDLFALLKFLKCSPFDDLTMWKKWIDNKSLGGQDRMNTVMSCILLRRTKVQLQERGQLACLPQRTAHQRHVTLTIDEMNVYQKVLVFSKTLFAQFLHQRAEKQAGATLALPSGKDTAYAEMHKKMIALQGAKPVKSHEILVLLLRLRQVCCHCGLIAAMLNEEDANAIEEDPGGKDLLAELNKLTLEESRSGSMSEPTEEQETPEEGTSVAEAIRSVLSVNNPVFNLTRLSSKIKDVMDCLRDNVFKNKGDKAVVVSQWTAVLRLVEQELRKERVRCVTLSGQVPVPARPPLIQAINDPKSDVKVMLLSLCAGGVGLNLVGANHLLLLDPHWNPQLEEQAQDRIYRVGQTKHCHVYRFMCVDTVEQSIRKLQEAKLELAANVLTGAKNTNQSKLSIEDLKVLFNM